MPLHTDLDNHLRRVVGNTGYTTSGSTATLPAASVDSRRLAELMDVAAVLKHDISLVSGVLTVKPR